VLGAASKCVLTIISCGVHYSLLASRLACLRDLMALKLAQRTPVVRLTASAASDQQQKQQKQQQKQASTTVTQSDSAAATTATSESADKDKDVSLLQRFKRIIDEKRESYEQERRKKAQQGSADVSGGTMTEVILGLLTPGNPGAAATVDATPATTTAATVSRSKPSATPEDDTGEAPTATATATSAADLRRRKVTSNTASTSDNNSTLRRSQSAESTSATCDDRQEKTTAQKLTTKSRSKQPLDTSMFCLVIIIYECVSFVYYLYCCIGQRSTCPLDPTEKKILSYNFFFTLYVMHYSLLYGCRFLHLLWYS